MSFYMDWGFTDNPFQTTALPPSKLGETLLVGRDDELAQLQRRLSNPPKLPTVEGLNGVGKTSLVNVATYRCFQDHLADRRKPLFIPCRCAFQLAGADLDLAGFRDHVLREVAQTLLESVDSVPDVLQKNPDSHQLNAWLNNPSRGSFQLGLTYVSAGYNVETNTGEGYSRSGFAKSVTNWLEAIFPDHNKGGVVCVIDNLELLQTSELARQQLEALRDELLNVVGLRWVLCGALGIVHGIASSPRLEGRLHSPIELRGVADDVTDEIYSSRVKAYGQGTTYLPIRPTDFTELYEILFRNLRSLLHYTDEFCQWAADRPLKYADNEKADNFRGWLNDTSRKYLSAANQQVGAKAWEVFSTAAERFNGAFSPGDFGDFGFNTAQALRSHVLALEAAQLVVSTRDDGDKRRKTIQITPKGWLANYARTVAGGA